MPYSSYTNLKKYQKKAFSLIELSVVVLIIGILIAGITSGSRLVRNSKLASAAQFTKSSDINSIADLVLWLEPTSDVFFMSVFGNINANNYYDYFNGYIGEVLVFDRALKTEEIDTINKYLSTKWSITLK